MDYQVRCGCGWRGTRSTLRNVNTAHVACPSCGGVDRLVDHPDAAAQAKASVVDKVRIVDRIQRGTIT